MADQTESISFPKRLVRHIISALAASLVLLAIYLKYMALRNGFVFAVFGAMLLYILMFFLFIFRHASITANVKPSHCFIAMSGTLLPLLMEIEPTRLDWLNWISLPIELVGIVLSVIAMYTLGRSFGIFAAKRAIKTNGVYRMIRHPLYAGESLWVFAFILQNLSLYNVLLFAVQSACQVHRILQEEALLQADEQYTLYAETVPWRLIPGLF